MNYIELYIPAIDSQTSEIYMAELSDLPFESFDQTDTYLKAYIREDHLEKCLAEVEQFLRTTGMKWHFTPIETINWNKEWESNFAPVNIDHRLTIRAPFHAPAKDASMEVIIMPKMSFGTGHHATTHLMAEEILNHDFSGKTVLDMGSGTGVLAIIAAKLGAVHIDAVDIEEWAYSNSIENIADNGVQREVKAILGDVNKIEGKKYDFVLANINTNVLLADMSKYAQTLNKGGEIMMSGILESDIPAICERAESLGFVLTKTATKDGWAMVLFDA